MKSLFNTFLFLFISFSFFSCTSVDNMPRFVSIFQGEIENVKLANYSQDKKNNIFLNFDKNIKDIVCTAFYDEEETKELPCSVKKQNENNEKDFLVSIEEGEKIEIGKTFYIKGEVKDKWGNSLMFNLKFVGVNTNPCILKISEVRPLYSKKPKSEFIEMIVVKEGNLSGIKILNVGSKEEPHYTFPNAYVEKGEIIVYHWRCFDERSQDEKERGIISKGVGATFSARDFWGKHKTLPRRKNNAIVIEESGNVQDAVLYCDTKIDDEDWASENIENAAIKAFESGVWTPSPNIKDAVHYHITPTTSIGRKIISQETKSNAKQWVLYKSKYVTEGKRNR